VQIHSQAAYDYVVDIFAVQLPKKSLIVKLQICPLHDQQDLPPLNSPSVPVKSSSNFTGQKFNGAGTIFRIVFSQFPDETEEGVIL